MVGTQAQRGDGGQERGLCVALSEPLHPPLAFRSHRAWAGPSLEP